MIFLFVGLLIIGVLVGGWVGLRIWPKPFPTHFQEPSPWQTMTFPKALPTPVERYFRIVFGDNVPVLTSAIISGRAKLRIAGIPFTGRWRFIHEAGCNYRHYIEATIFGYPIIKVNERYVDRVSCMELPVGTIENNPRINQAANLALWGESIWLPSVFLTDPRVKWEAIDDHSAKLNIPFDDQEDYFTVYFDHDTGLISHMEAMRWRDAKDQAKTRWQLNIEAWTTFKGIHVPSVAAVTWEFDKKPWLVCYVEELVYNANIRDDLCRRGI